MTRQTVEPQTLTTLDTAVCPTCGQLWRLCSSVMATPLTRVDQRWKPAHYTIDGIRYAAGLDPLLSHHVDDGGPTITKWWACGDHTMAVALPAYDRVVCLAAPGVPCAVAALQANPPDDLYVNARYGGACGCCGHNGSHLVRRDGTDAPTCSIYREGATS